MRAADLEKRIQAIQKSIEATRDEFLALQGRLIEARELYSLMLKAEQTNKSEAA